MCGIIGVIGKLPEKKKFERARETLAHRGPDDSGTYYNAEECVALGHRRLSIIDLSVAGRQPFFSNDGRFVVTFNGEIYNYLEIKEKLKGHYNFNTKTDTEVLLASYIHWGEKCVDRFNGMFAFALWDKKVRKLFCARDRIGIKPFFYSVRNGSFYFSSEIKALLSLGIPRQSDERIIFEYLYHGMYDHRSETFFEGVKRLNAGHALVWKNGRITEKKYWDLADKRPHGKYGTKKEVDERFEELLADSMKLQFRSDVPVGINLSSGADSNLLLYFAKKVAKHAPDLFSICSRENEFNECIDISTLLSETEKKKWYTCYTDSREIWHVAEKMNKIQDQPFGGVPTILYDGLNREAKKGGTTVLLEGQGLDELLAGYKYYLLDYAKDRHGNAKKGDTVSSISYSQDLSSLTDEGILRKDFVSQWGKEKLSFISPFKSNLLNAQYRDIVYAKLPRVLRFNDHVSMAHGRELRVPFLDHRIVEFCFYLPARYKINAGGQKVLIRKMLQKFLGNNFFMKQKKSFGAVQTEILRTHYKKEIHALLRSRSFRERGYWDDDALMEKTNEFFSGKMKNSFFLWQCINLELWFRKFID